MLAYKTYVTVKDPKQLILSDLPFRIGQRLEVVLIADDNQRAMQVQELRALFKTTQTLPQAKAISEEDIAAEIAAYRAGR